ncbi:UDP-glycosyltransferase 73C11 [Manihot esculenta]|uniref:Glycosyltransferase n=1 Tax=Manihot esculenta TaxID=3983 RepID=A0A2C9WK35_MANES|nr:UDP-glycosyltransferase 73C11 [Manihot esculenta]OAY60545.1 hypothetical protein MANES_01G120600v8 [Manihot esculenta]
MPSQTQQLHFVLFPLMAQGHMIPMIDIARLLAQHGVMISIVTTPLNAARFKTVLARAVKSGLKIQVFELQFPSEIAGLPEGCENFDMLPSLEMGKQMFTAIIELEKQADKLLEELIPQPSCIISDMCFPWTVRVASKWKVPRISFIGFSCFCMLCCHNTRVSKVLENITSESEYFAVPGLPDSIKFTKAQMASLVKSDEFVNRMIAAEKDSYGIIINTFEELEAPFFQQYKKAGQYNRIWCVGPVSQCNKDTLDKAERGNETCIKGHECLRWLDSWQTGSVVYACLGSLPNIPTSQLIELGLGLEASNRPFIWVVRGGERSKEIEKWISETGFEERTKGRGLVICGWAPQVMILSHPAVGGFLTHCGWNSTLEAISNGVPLITWPLFADQFSNEKLAVQVLKIGVRVGVEVPERGVEEGQNGVLVKREDVKRAVDDLMKEGEESEERRRRVKELALMAKKATEKGGSSSLNIRLLIQDVTQHVNLEQTNLGQV